MLIKGNTVDPMRHLVLKKRALCGDVVVAFRPLVAVLVEVVDVDVDVVIDRLFAHLIGGGIAPKLEATRR